MKKLVTLALLFSFVGTAAYALSPEEEKKPGFWDKEAERSGISGTRLGNWFKNMNPAPFFKSQQERYAARKAGSQAGHASDQAVAHASSNSAVAATN